MKLGGIDSSPRAVRGDANRQSAARWHWGLCTVNQLKVTFSQKPSERKSGGVYLKARPQVLSI